MHDTTRIKLKINKSRYRTWLERANDIDCLTLIWAAQALQSGHEKFAGLYITYPKEAVTEQMDGPYAVYKWELETIVTSLLTTPKDKPRTGRYHYTNLTKFESLGSLVNYLRAIENGEYARTGTADNIWEEMYRIGQRQFSWQRGYNSEQLYRYAYVYGQGECGEFFEKRNGIPVSNFIFLSLMIFALAMEKPWLTAPKNTADLKLSQDDLEKTLTLQSIELAEARVKASRMNADASKNLGAPLKTAYMPSILRQYPMIKNAGSRGTTYCAPLPPLVMNRATAGLFYDIKQGPTRLLTEANARFEEYVRKLVRAYHPRVQALKGEPYGRKAIAIDPPDCLIKDGEHITVAIECKATKLTFEAQFAENPTIAARQGFEQLAKGIFQLWRFFSHARRGIYADHQVSPNAYGIVLTMDSWMQMAHKLREGAVERAKELSAADPDIIEGDMRMVIFASVQELNDTFAQTDTDAFMAVLHNAASERYRGYGLPEVARESDIEHVRKGFPLDVEELLPWWEMIKNSDDRPFL